MMCKNFLKFVLNTLKQTKYFDFDETFISRMLIVFRGMLLIRYKEYYLTGA